jgi:hypothetical protein
MRRAANRLYMGRGRNRELDIVMALASLTTLVVFAASFVPAVRQILLSFGVVLFGLAAVIGIVVLGVRFLFPGQHSEIPQHTTLNTVAPFHESDPQLNQPSTSQLIEQLRSIDWFQFEKIVEILYRKFGYTSARRGGANPDGGIDLIIEKEGQKTAVQCKQWKTWKVGVKSVREFLGALKDAGIERGVFVTLRGYTGEAKHLADKHGIKIVDETELAQMLGSVDLKSDPELLALLRDDRKFCPKCEQQMILRTAARGSNSGQSFWGCSAFPRCRYTLSA